LVSISEASHVLGVSEAALRHWTDEGKIKAFITPGGHRRYSIVDLKKFISSHQKVHGIRDLATELEDTAQMHREIARAYLSSSWYHKLSQEHQERFVSNGRQLLNLVIRYITQPSKREEVIQLAHDVGHYLGETLAEIGLPLTDSLEAFILHRDPLMKAATQWVRRGEAFSGRVVEAIPLVAHVMDEALVSLVAAHQQYKDVSRQRGC
jgi:excisionase family DNA binding protein